MIRGAHRPLPPRDEDDSASSSFYPCDCPACCPQLYDFMGALDNEPFLTHWEVYKERNRRSQATQRQRSRRTRRVPVASSAFLDLRKYFKVSLT